MTDSIAQTKTVRYSVFGPLFLRQIKLWAYDYYMGKASRYTFDYLRLMPGSGLIRMKCSFSRNRLDCSPAK
jgi:hypothetical protein